jgi:putative ABC transport system permease protein
MREFLTDLVFAGRMFRKRPAFAVTAIATLALGIGASAAIFSVVNAVLLRPLPYSDAGRLVHVAADMRTRSVVDFPWPPGDYADLRDNSTRFDGIAALVTGRQVVVEEGESDAVMIRTGAATPNLFRVLGAKLAAGSDFTEADGAPLPPQNAAPPPAGVAAPPQAPPPPQKAILSHEFWQRRFGGDPSVVGRIVNIGRQQRFEVIGVLEPAFELLYPPRLNVERAPDLWTPLRVNFATASRNNVFLRVIGRLKRDASVADAQREVDAVAADLRARYTIKQTAGLFFRIEPLQTDLVRDVKPAILALMGAVVFVLLIACANVANLLLVRAAARERELAVRAAMGSTRGRLIRQMLAESLLLAGIAALTGLGLAWLGVRLLLRLAPENLPRLNHVAIDPFVIGFAALAGLVSSVAFGLLPALRASRPDVMDLLRRAGRTGSLSSGRWLRNTVAVVEVALSFVLLVGSGLMIRSFIALQNTNPGYDPAGVLTMQVPVLQTPNPQARAAFMRDLRARLLALPGVEAVTAATPLPLDGGNSLARWGTEEALSDASKFQQSFVHIVLPGYFDALRTRVIEGRGFDETDNRPDANVIIIDRILANKAFKGQSAVGKTLVVRVNTPEPVRMQVIGVVEHQRHASLATEAREGMFVTDGLFNHGAASRWAIRASGDLMALVPAAKAAVTALNPRTGAIEIQPMSAFVAQAQAETKFALILIGIFAGIALVLASVGLYSVLSTLVRQRTAEIGVRMAFGAQHSRIFGMMVAEGLRLSAIGLVVGIAAAFALTGLMRTMLIGVKPTDPATFAAMTVGFLAIAAIACGVPAIRAARMDPMVALRDD